MAVALFTTYEYDAGWQNGGSTVEIYADMALNPPRLTLLRTINSSDDIINLTAIRRSDGLTITRQFGTGTNDTPIPTGAAGRIPMVQGVSGKWYMDGVIKKE